MSARTVVTIAKNPVPGRVKTRLQARFTSAQAAALALAALQDSLSAVAAADLDRRVVALDGPAGPWLPAGFEVVGQGGGGLDERLEHSFAEVFGTGRNGPVLLIGMDTPQVTAELLGADWEGADAVLGLCPDGGFWAVGLRRWVPGAFRSVPMSTDHTGAAQLARLRDLGLSVHLLPQLQDVDTPADADAVAALAPWTRFAAEHQRLGRDPASGRRPESAASPV